MNTGKYVFAQVSELLSANDFLRFVSKYDGNFKVQHFSCWNQLMCMLFGQFSNRDSLSDLIICLESQRSKWYHLGMGIGISKSNLAYANEKRDWRIFSEFAYSLIAQARIICSDSKDLGILTEGNVYAIDSTTIDLCLSIFWWAPFRKTKAAVKLHTEFDLKTEIPTYVHLSDGLVHDVKMLDQLEFEQNAFYIMDRGYVSLKQLYRLHKSGAYFVTRSKSNMDYRRLYSMACDKLTGVLCDQHIKFNNHYPSLYYPEAMRRIKYRDLETKKTLEFLTNNFDLDSIDIAKLYKHRWKIELFFKWIKQHLKIKSFWGHSENAVRIQVYSAIIAYTLVAILKEKHKINYSTYEILQILSITLLSKTHINQLFCESYQQTIKELKDNQLNLF